MVGGGLAGLSAALAAEEEAARLGKQVRVLVLEKATTLGGNSAKASSGINAVNPDVGDTREAFKGDTFKSGGGMSDEELVSLLVVRVFQHLDL